MSVCLVRQGTYRYDIMVNGQRYTKSGFKSEKEALVAQEARKKEVEREEIRQEVLMAQGITSQASFQDTAFSELLVMRLNMLEKKRSKRHFEDTKLLAKRWIKEWGKLMCSEIRPIDIERFRMKREKEASAFTANKELTHLKALFNYGVKLELVARNPAKDLKHFDYDPAEKHVPTDAELDRLIGVAEPEIAEFLWVLRETFARVGEVIRLLWKDIDFERRTVTLHTYKSAKGKLTPRDIPMTERLFSLLKGRSERVKTKPEELVFSRRWFNHKTGEWEEGSYKKRQGLMKSLCEQAGIELRFGFHAIRHAGATRLVEAGVPAPIIQQLLGHSTIQMTMHYVHVENKAKFEAIQRFETARGDSHTIHTHGRKEVKIKRKRGRALKRNPLKRLVVPEVGLEPTQV